MCAGFRKLCRGSSCWIGFIGIGVIEYDPGCDPPVVITVTVYISTFCEHAIVCARTKHFGQQIRRKRQLVGFTRKCKGFKFSRNQQCSKIIFSIYSAHMLDETAVLM